MKTRIRGVLLASTLLTIAAPAWAQTDAAPECVPDTDTSCPAEEATEVTVTGSRIARPEVDSPSPVTAIDSTQLLQRGAANVSDILNELPQVGIGSTRTNTNFLTSGTGISTINLRSLGANRTLTLVNGRRFISGFAGDSSVDINNIPIDLIERTDLVTGGSSAVYGSDAIAGVVNFILRDKFDGLQVRAQGSVTERGDNGRYLISALAGKSFADDRGSVILNFQYDRDNGLFSRDRAISAQDCFDLTCGPEAYSSFAPQGQFQLSGIAPNNAGVPTRVGQAVLPGGNTNFSFNPDNSLATLPGYAAGAYGYNRNAVRYIATPLERYLAYGLFKFEVSDRVEVYAEGTFARTSSNSSMEASALQDSDVYGTPGVGIPITNAFIPSSIAAAIAAANADANPNNNVDTLLFRRRQNDVFDRSNRVQRDTWRGVLGVRGDLGSNLNYDVSYVYGHLNDFNSSQDIDNARYRNALDSIRVGPGNAIGTDIVCRDQAARAQGCVPINLFGYNTVDPRAASYVQASVPKSEEITNEQHVVTAALSSSSLFDFGAGGVGAAIGVEYRYESTVSDLDILTNTGGNSGNQIPDLRGNQDVREVFGELNVPLLADKPFFNYFGVNGAIRYSDYSTIGGVLSWNAGAEWELTRGVRLRGRYAVSNRAPNNSELYSAASETFAAVTDPCNGITATSTGAADAACRAVPGIANFFAGNPGGTFAYTASDLQGINGFVGGNPNLQEETAKTITAGIVLTPRAIPGLSFSVDYFDIKIDGAINTLGRSYTIQQCLLTGQSVFCDNVIRSAGTGFVETVNAQLINIAAYETRGFDAQLRYNRALGLVDGDQLGLNINYTYTLDYKTQSDPASPLIESAGTFGPSFSTHRATARATYGVEGSTISWQTTLLSGAPYINLNDNFISNDPDVLALNDIKDYWLHNVQLSQNVGDAFTLYLNVDNIFDTKPQYLPGSPFGTPTGLETSDAFDVFGRRFTAGFRARF